MKRKRNDKRRTWPGKALAATVLSLAVLQPTAAMASGTSYVAITSEGKAVSADSATPAEAKITKEQAVEIIKSLFPQYSGMTVTSVQLGDMNSFPPPNQNVWTIGWQYTVGNTSYGYNSKVDSITGDLLEAYFHYPDVNGNSYYPPSYSREEAADLAKAFIKKAAPSLAEESLKESPESIWWGNQGLFRPVQYHFNFTYDVNSISSPSDGIQITIDGEGNIIQYHRSEAGHSYPSPTPAISADAAAKAYESAAQITLQYIPVYSPTVSEKKWLLAWSPYRLEGIAIDAHTGDYLDAMGVKLNPKQTVYGDVEKKSAVFTPAKGSDNGLLTAEEAAKLLEQTIGIPQEKKLSNQFLRENGYMGDSSRKVWELTWMEERTQPQEFPKTTRASIDAKTGQILDYGESEPDPYWMYGQAEQEKPEVPSATISMDEARGKAMEIVNKLYPSAAEELKLILPNENQDDGEARRYSFQFQRFYKGLPVGGEMAWINIDPATGKLSSYFSNYTENLDKALSGLEATMSGEDAKAEYTKNTTIKLQYRKYGGYYGPEGAYTPYSVKLVYDRVIQDSDKFGSVLNAVTGEWERNIYGVIPDREADRELPEDAVGHWASEDLATLVKYQVLQADEAGKLQPDASITLGDWMNMVMKAVEPNYQASFAYMSGASAINFSDVEPNSPYYSASQMYLQYQWLDLKKTPALKPEQPLTRELLAENLVYLMKYDQLSELLGEGSLDSFADGEAVSVDKRGDVTLAVQLGLLTATSDNRLEPNRTVTKAEASVIIMRLAKLQGKLDQRLVQ